MDISARSVKVKSRPRQIRCTIAFMGLLQCAGSGCSDSHPTLAEVSSREASREVGEEEERYVVYFLAPGCPDCQEVDETVVPELSGRGFLVDKVNVETPEGFQLLRAIEDRLGATCEVLAPVIVISDTVVCGPSRIREFFFGASSFLENASVD